MVLTTLVQRSEMLFAVFTESTRATSNDAFYFLEYPSECVCTVALFVSQKERFKNISNSACVSSSGVLFYVVLSECAERDRPILTRSTKRVPTPNFFEEGGVVNGRLGCSELTAGSESLSGDATTPVPDLKLGTLRGF